ncbi:MAG TPA: tetratricopeptide repeat protein [Dongiaceae bacterium]|nr:tetratricopeptide repeat protein [Dongiaceae bacterium]
MDRMDRGENDQALADARHLTERTPADPASWRALGHVQTGRKAFKEAEQALLHAIALAPRDAISWEHLGWHYRRSGDFARAAAALQEALSIDGGRMRARMLLANSLADLGKSKRSIAEYRQVLQQEPDHFRAHNNLANLLAESGQLKAAAEHYIRAAGLSQELTFHISAAHAARRIGDWSGADVMEASFLQSLRHGGRPRDRAQPFPLIAMPDATAADQLAAGRQMARIYAGAEPVPHHPVESLDARPRLRIAYLSSDLYDHATTHLIVEALELHDRGRFEIVGFDYSANRRSGYRSRVLKAFDRVIPIGGLSDAAAAHRIAAEGIAVAIDLKGWTTRARPQILAHRPAPVRVQWLGYPGSMGAPWIDYAIADHIVAPPGGEAEFSEKLVRLPHCYQPNDRNRVIGPVPTREACGLPENALVCCCFNQPFKITPAVFALWMDLLRAAPDAVLWLKDDNRWDTAALKERARDAGIESSRLVFAPTLPLSAHLARLSLADLALDCAPCGSHTTASDALWAGVPQVACLGNTFAARVSASLVTAVGLPDLVVRSLQEYRALILRLATERGWLAELRARLAANRLTTPLFDSNRFIRHLEAGYEAMWRCCVGGLAPDHIDIVQA